MSQIVEVPAKPDDCPTCIGTGWIGALMSDWRRCPACSGSGKKQD